MIAHRSIVAWGFKLYALLTGAPALIASVFLTIESIRAHEAAAPDGAHLISVRTYGIAGLLTDFGVGVDHMFRAFAGFASWLLAGLAVVMLIGAIFSGGLFLIGRGIGRSAAWARFVGAAFAALLAVMSALAATGVPHRLVVAPLLTFALGLYTLWVLIWRFGAPDVVGPPSDTALPSADPTRSD